MHPLARGAAVAVVLAFIGDLVLQSSDSEAEMSSCDPTGVALDDGRKPAHVIVVGGGLAGLSAAIAAAEAGAQVTLLEKSERIGGNSAKATSGINAWGTAAQRKLLVDDNAALLEKDTAASAAGGNPNRELIWALSTRSRDAVDWLSTLGVPLSVLSQLGGHSRKRTHRAPDKPDGTPTPIGFTIIQTLDKHLRSSFPPERVSIVTSATVMELIEDKVSGAVVGVRYRRASSTPTAVAADDSEVELRADAVILCTGGFSNDHTSTSLLAEFAPTLTNHPTTNGPFATGDGIKMARRLGVELIDMDKVQLHPTGFVNPTDPNSATKFLGPEALRGSGGVLLNAKGERFVNELDLRSVVTAAIQAQGNRYPGTTNCLFAYCVLNDAAADAFGRGALNFYWKRLGMFRMAANVSELARILGAEAERVAHTLAEYEEAARSGKPCPHTGKTVYPTVVGVEGPFYVAVVTPSIHYTMGGCAITAGAAMIRSSTAGVAAVVVPGLYGAGEVTGGVHGGNRLGGNSLLECAVFGRIAGRRAVAASRSTTSCGEWSAEVLAVDRDLHWLVVGLGSAASPSLDNGLRVSLDFADGTAAVATVQSRHGSEARLHVESPWLGVEDILGGDVVKLSVKSEKCEQSCDSSA